MFAACLHASATLQRSFVHRHVDMMSSDIPSLANLDETCNFDERCIFFVTGNTKKELEVNTILSAQEFGSFRVSHVDLDLPEYQGSPEYIARHKCIEAANQVESAVLVEDTSLCFDALNGLPGPYIKWFVDQLGNDGLYQLLNAHENKQAYCQCILAFSAGPGAEPIMWTGKCRGTIVSPRGSGGFGWDAIFIPEGKETPFGEMSLDEKNTISHRARALEQFVEYCRNNEDAIFDAIDAASADLV